VRYGVSAGEVAEVEPAQRMMMLGFVCEWACGLEERRRRVGGRLVDRGV